MQKIQKFNIYSTTTNTAANPVSHYKKNIDFSDPKQQKITKQCIASLRHLEENQVQARIEKNKNQNKNH